MIYRLESDYLHTNDALSKQKRKGRRKREKHEDHANDNERQCEHQDAESLIDLVA